MLANARMTNQTDFHCGRCLRYRLNASTEMILKGDCENHTDTNIGNAKKKRNGALNHVAPNIISGDPATAKLNPISRKVLVHSVEGPIRQLSMRRSPMAVFRKITPAVYHRKIVPNPNNVQPAPARQNHMKAVSPIVGSWISEKFETANWPTTFPAANNNAAKMARTATVGAVTKFTISLNSLSNSNFGKLRPAGESGFGVFFLRRFFCFAI